MVSPAQLGRFVGPEKSTLVDFFTQDREEKRHHYGEQKHYPQPTIPDWVSLRTRRSGKPSNDVLQYWWIDSQIVVVVHLV